MDIKKFGDEKQFGNIYCRFFRTCLLQLIAMFKEYDQVVIDNIFHDKTTEMEIHPYFNKNAKMKKMNLPEPEFETLRGTF